MSFEAIVKDDITGLHTEASLIPSFFVGARENESCIASLMAMPLESSAANCLPRSHRTITNRVCLSGRGESNSDSGRIVGHPEVILRPTAHDKTLPG
jgi:hypothetical protein